MTCMQYNAPVSNLASCWEIYISLNSLAGPASKHSLLANTKKVVPSLHCFSQLLREFSENSPTIRQGNRLFKAVPRPQERQLGFCKSNGGAILSFTLGQQNVLGQNLSVGRVYLFILRGERGLASDILSPYLFSTCNQLPKITHCCLHTE